MTADQIFEVLQKLTGPVEPQGESTTDAERYESMKTFISVLNKMNATVDNIWFRYKDDERGSVSKITDLCTKQIEQRPF